MRTNLAFIYIVACGVLAFGKAPKNLAPNGDFEETAWLLYGVKWARHWSPYRTKAAKGKSVTVLDSGMAYSGKNCLKIVCPQKGSVNLKTRPYIRVRPGKKYQFSIWLKGDGNAKVRFAVMAYRGRKRLYFPEGCTTASGKKAALKNKWQKYSHALSFSPLVDRVYLVVYVWFPDRCGPVYVDNISLSEK